MPKLFASFALALLLTTTSGCAAIIFDDLPNEKSAPVIPIVLGPGDKVRVELWDEPRLTGEYIIGPDGALTVPIAGAVKVKGVTLERAANLLAEKLKEYFTAPSVTVTLIELKSMYVHVTGEVGHPGTVPFRAGMTIVDVIQASGSYIHATANTDDVRIIRGRLDKPEVYKIDMEDIFAARMKDVYLRPGDIVMVPPRWTTISARWIGQFMAPIWSIMGVAQVTPLGAATSAMSGGLGGAP